MSSENVELAWRMLGANPGRPERVPWDAERWADASRLWDPDIEYQEDPGWPGATTVRGREAVVARFLEYAEYMGEASVEVLDVLDAGGDQVVLLTRISGEAVASGAPWEYAWAYLATIRDGRAVRVRAFLDAAAALRA